MYKQSKKTLKRVGMVTAGTSTRTTHKVINFYVLSQLSTNAKAFSAIKEVMDSQAQVSTLLYKINNSNLIFEARISKETKVGVKVMFPKEFQCKTLKLNHLTVKTKKTTLKVISKLALHS